MSLFVYLFCYYSFQRTFTPDLGKTSSVDVNGGPYSSVSTRSLHKWLDFSRLSSVSVSTIPFLETHLFQLSPSPSLLDISVNEYIPSTTDFPPFLSKFLFRVTTPLIPEADVFLYRRCFIVSQSLSSRTYCLQ